MRSNTRRNSRHRRRNTRHNLFYAAVAVIVTICIIVCITVVFNYNAKAHASSVADSGDTADLPEEAFTPLDCNLSYELQEYTYYMCKFYGVDFELAMAVMYVESAYDTAATSSTGDYGLMQINEIVIPELSERLYITDITEPTQNITAGLYILSDLSSRYDDTARVLMSYNIGEYGAAALWEAGTRSTSYTDKVIEKYTVYKEAKNG